MYCLLIKSQRILDLTGAIKNLTFFNQWQCYIMFQKVISLITVKITYYCRFYRRVVDHVTFCYFTVTHIKDWGPLIYTILLDIKEMKRSTGLEHGFYEVFSVMIWLAF